MPKEVLLSHKLQVMELSNGIRLKEDNPSQRTFKNKLCHPKLSHIEQKYEENLMYLP